jgi:hypothetical protein
MMLIRRATSVCRDKSSSAQSNSEKKWQLFSSEGIVPGDRFDLSLVGTTFDVASSWSAALVSIAKSRPLAVSELAASNICSCF